ncbi:MAG TPA: phosphate ABC transporter permease subunit PstC [Fimbriimonadaceae bacterium]|nr:phosphate ABC transporter permease subunit PstC [Fimbriimonadaceae bacterium]
MTFADPARTFKPGGKSRSRAVLRLVADRFFAGLSMAFGIGVILLIGWIGIRLYLDSALTRDRFGWSMLSASSWDVPHEIYGAATFIFGTLVSSFVALLVAVPIGLGASLFLTEVAPKWLATPISFIIELLAAVPSIVYGLWGFMVLCPFLQNHLSPWLSKNLGSNPLFGGAPALTNVLAAGLILAIMIMPFITAVSREVIRTVPTSMREASLGLGCTRWETIKNVVLPASKAGISGACILGLGRAIGETMAVVMVIGNTPQIKASLLQPAYTMSGLLANQFNEAFDNKLQRSALLEIALILFVITLLVNALARLLIVAAKSEISGRKPTSERVLRLRRAVTRITDFIGRFGVGGSVGGLTLLQFISDFRQFGAAAFLRTFELGVVAVLLIVAAFRTFKTGTVRVRHLLDSTMRVLFSACGILACFVLGAVLYYVADHGFKGLSLQLFTQTPGPAGSDQGGLKNAMLGTVLLVGIAGAVGIPMGLLAGIYVAEFSNGRLGGLVRFAADVLNGIPSVVVGLFAYAAFVLPFGHFSGWAGGLSLAVIMIPTVARTTEDMLRLVPNSYREAALGLGASRVQMIRTVVVPAAKAGVLTGVMLAIARVAGETAPLLFTAFGNDLVNMNPGKPVSSLTMSIYLYSVSPYDSWINQAWAGALVLLLFVLTLSLAARLMIVRSRVRLA